MSLYPSLEDMKVDQMASAQYTQIAENIDAVTKNNAVPIFGIEHFDSKQDAAITNNSYLYPSLNEFMGLELSNAVIAENMPEYSQIISYPTNPRSTSGTGLIAPLSGNSLGLQKAQITHGVRELVLCKDQDGKVGIRVKAINKGIFVSVIVDKSPAALAGLRFGDQILQINGENVAGYSMDKVHTMFKKSPVNGIKVAVRDRPFERTITLHKDSVGCLGFQFKNGKIITIVKDSSAARNGILTEHQLLEVDGRNVVGLKDKDITNIIQQAGPIVTVTVIPYFLYEHMIKSMSGSLLKDLMDHSIPV